MGQNFKAHKGYILGVALRGGVVLGGFYLGWVLLAFFCVCDLDYFRNLLEKGSKEGDTNSACKLGRVPSSLHRAQVRNYFDVTG